MPASASKRCIFLRETKMYISRFFLLEIREHAIVKIYRLLKSLIAMILSFGSIMKWQHNNIRLLKLRMLFWRKYLQVLKLYFMPTFLPIENPSSWMLAVASTLAWNSATLSSFHYLWSLTFVVGVLGSGREPGNPLMTLRWCRSFIVGLIKHIPERTNRIRRLFQMPYR